jgi:uroporphyrinogen decarboxylase
MTRKEVIIEALASRPVPYVPWSWGPTGACARRLKAHLGADDLWEFLDPHTVGMAAASPGLVPVGKDRLRDAYGVVWDRTVDKDIGTPCDWPIRRPEDLADYDWPDAANDDWYAHIPGVLAANRDRYCEYMVHFSLYERAWSMRGLSSLLMDMVERPEFVEALLDCIVEHNLLQIRRALAMGVDGVYFGDDYGMQSGLIMGIAHWRHFFKPRLARMFAPVREAGKCVRLHSCGRVTELFDDLIEIGLNVFNPFQPEVMDVFDLLRRYHGRLAFHGGMSIQQVLPFAGVEEVRRQTRRLLAAGRAGGYIFSPSHDVPGDVPPENLAAMQAVLKAQPGYAA